MDIVVMELVLVLADPELWQGRGGHMVSAGNGSLVACPQWGPLPGAEPLLRASGTKPP